MTLDMMMLFKIQYETQSMEEITDTLDIIKIKNLNSAKNNVKKMRKQGTDWEKIFAIDTSDKEPLSKIYVQRTQIIIKQDKDLNRQFTKEDIQIANKHKHIKRCFTSWLVRKMQTRIIRYHYTPFRMVKIQNTDAPNTGEDVETLNKNSKDTWEDFLAVFLIKVNILLPYDPIIKLLGVYPKELKDYIHTKTYTQMFVAALFIIVKTWKQQRYLSIGEWMNKLWYIQILEYFSVQKK